MQVVRIFTDKSISPSPSPRQYPNHYAFRAGRNLPDKEFRPQDRYRYGRRSPGLQLPASLMLTDFFNLLALGRRQPPYIVLRLSGDLCFW